MKELEFILKPEKLEDLKLILDENGCSGMSIYTIMGCGAQRGYVGEAAVQSIRGMKTKIASGTQGDGKIFIKPVLDAVRIRTGERGNKAI